jgi:hypothetical protein
MRGRSSPPRRRPFGDRPYLALVLLAAAIGVLVVWFVGAERRIYFWDWSGYWRATIDLAGQLRHHPLGSLATVLRTVRRDDYNLAAALPLAPAAMLFGGARTVYVLSLALLYALPAVVALALVADGAFVRFLGARPASSVVPLVTIALLPAFWVPVLVGLPDVVGCVVIAYVWWELREPILRTPRARLVRAALGLTLLVVLRRWYAYWVVALLVSFALDELWEGRRGALFVTAWSRLAAVGGGAALAFFAVAGPKALAMLGTDYTRLYAAYRYSDPVRDAAIALVRDFGPLWLSLVASGALLALRERRTRALARRFLAASVVAIVLFVRTQALNAHHELLVAPQMAVFAAVAAGALASIRPAAVRRAGIAVLLALLLVNLACVLVPGVSSALGPAAVAFAKMTYHPVVRGDLAEVARLVRELDQLTRDGKKVYVLSSSVLLNEDVVRNARLVDPSLPNLDDRVLDASHVDARDGFPWGLAVAHFVVVSDPVGYHLDPADQRVVGLPAGEIVRGTTIGRSFVRLPGVFVLDQGTRVSLFARTEELRREDLDALLAHFRAVYPDDPGFALR